MTESTILIEQADDAITQVTLNRPEKRNALSMQLMTQLQQAIARAAGDLRQRVLILRGAGPAFCAGLDLTEAADPKMAHCSSEILANLYETIYTCPLIVIAAAHGAAYGGGAGLIAAADFAVGADDLQIGFPEVKRGLVAALVTCLLRRTLSERQVRELIMLGQVISANQAEKLDLIHRVAPAADLGSAAIALAREICAGAPDAIVRTKNLLDDTAPRPIAHDLGRALSYHLSSRQSAEAIEGIAAFREKRPPRWVRARYRLEKW